MTPTLRKDRMRVGRINNETSVLFGADWLPKGKIRCGEGLLITLNFRCKLQFSSSYSYSALFAYPLGHHSRNDYLIPLAEGLFESPTEVLRRELQNDSQRVAILLVHLPLGVPPRIT